MASPRRQRITAQVLLLLPMLSAASPAECGSQSAEACVAPDKGLGRMPAAANGVDSSIDTASWLQLPQSQRQLPQVQRQQRQRPEAIIPPAGGRSGRGGRGCRGIHPPDMSDLHCRPVQGGIPVGPQKRLRREIHLWSDEAFAAFSEAVNELYKRPGSELSNYPNTYASLVEAHPYCHKQSTFTFLPWHRHFLNDFETVLQNISGDCELTLPFWNWNRETGQPWGSKVFDANRYGMRPKCHEKLPGLDICLNLTIPGKAKCPGTGGGFYCVDDGIAAGWTENGLPSDPNDCRRCVRRAPGHVIPLSYPDVIGRLQTEQEFFRMSNFIEMAPHVDPHTNIFGGTMFDIPVSPADPAFFLHHAYVDELFSWWQKYQLTRNGVDTSTCSPQCASTVLPFYNESLEEWLGYFDPGEDCVMYPKSNPRVCLSYQSEVAEDDLSLAAVGQASETQCDRILKKLDLGQCDPSAMSHVMERTCGPLHAKDMKQACRGWFKSTPPSIAQASALGLKIQECDADVDSLAREQTGAHFLQPSSHEEATLCFKCTPALEAACSTS